MLLSIRRLETYKLIWTLIILATVAALFYYSSKATDSWTLNVTDRKIHHLTLTDLKSSKTDLLRIITSVKNELIKLEKTRDNLINTIRENEGQLNTLRYEIYQYTLEADRYRISLKEFSRQHVDLQSVKSPLLHLPLIHNSEIPANYQKYKLESSFTPYMCDLHQCFHWNLCSINKHLDVYFVKHADINDFTEMWSDVYSNMNVLSSSLQTACIHLHFSQSSFKTCHTNKENCLLVLERALKKDEIIQYGIIASADILRHTYRPGFDIVLSALSSINYEEIWHHIPPTLPVARSYFLHFKGYYGPKRSWPTEITSITSTLNDMTMVRNHLNFTCEPSYHFHSSVHHGEWQLCEGAEDLVNYPASLKESTFCLILSPINSSTFSSISLQHRLTQCLMASSIPVILGKMILPFEEVLPQWKAAVIQLPKARVAELEVILSSYPEEDIVEMRRQGRLILDRCLGSNSRRARCLHLLLSRRLHLTPPDRSSVHSKSIADTVSISRTYPVTSNVYYVELDNHLGPVVTPLNSIEFRRNISSQNLNSDVLNPITGDLDPFYKYPSVPWEPILPPQAQFQDSIPGYRPINHSMSRAGVEFAESLGGNRKYEQFTIVIISYNRLKVLLSNIENYNNLPYLHSIVIVWNNPKPPPKSLKWPRLSVPIHVIRGPQRNSLNNRFVPYDVIKTDAVFSLDDDVDMRQDEIVFGFRTWRENRDLLVGFPARFHSWDNVTQQWEYQSSRTCEFSMILSGAAFFHKYYLYAYSFVMPASIREMVDTYMNCEDIAMNFLIAHTTRKPPIKVTSRWTFQCADCPSSLHDRADHYQQRSSCINYLTQIYGYNPLLYTQYRVDSVLFKTRLSADKQKCFKYI